MTHTEWSRVPLGTESARWRTRADCRTVLAAVHTVTCGQRLLEIVDLLERDPRVQVVFTKAPDVFNNGVDRLLSDLRAVVVPWQQALHTGFDLAITAAYGGIAELRAPLVVLPHGAGYGKLVTRSAGGGAAAARGFFGLDRQRLVRDGAVIPSALVLSHMEQLAILAETCPEATPVAVVAGDPWYDRLAAGIPHRDRYRRCLGLHDGQKCVVVASTWGTRSLFARGGELLLRLTCELSQQDFQVWTLLHPNVWFGHGERQVRAWLADACDLGLRLLSPEDDWRPILTAADWAICDHGSLSLYAAAAGIPLLLACCDVEAVGATSPAAQLARAAPFLHRRRPLLDQLASAAESHRPERYDAVASRITSVPGESRRILRQTLYRLLGLVEPLDVPSIEPVRPYCPLTVGRTDRSD